MNNRERPIGVFDSGVGGISVLREAVKELPGEDFIYFGDSLNAPYGTKTAEEVLKLALENSRFLLDKGVKALVIACNTATAVSAKELRNMYPDIPIVGVEPAIKPALTNGENPKVLVMATEVTLREQKFNELLKKYEHLGEVIPLPCSGLMEWVERGILEGEEIENFLKTLLKPYADSVDSVVLGCTHYFFLEKEIKKILGKKTAVFDGGAGTAKELRRRLESKNLVNNSAKKGKVEFLSSDKSGKEAEMCEKLFYI